MATGKLEGIWDEKPAAGRICRASMDFSSLRTYILQAVARTFHLILALGLAGLAAGSVHGQSSARISVDQISRAPATVSPPARPGGNAAGDPVRVAPVRGGSSSASAREAQRAVRAPAVPPEIVEACRQAQAEDRSPPAGVDCIAAMQAANEPPAATAESSLLALFGQPGNVTNISQEQAGSSVNADNVARDLSSGAVPGSGAAGAVARDQAAPPPSSPR